MREKTNRLYQFNGFQLDVDAGILSKEGDVVPLTPKAFDTLTVLLKNRGRVVAKDILFNEVWANTFVEDGTLTQNISTLRKVLGTPDDGKQFIETVPRRGYKFVAEVTEFLDSETPLISQKHNFTGMTADDQHVKNSSPGAPPKENYLLFFTGHYGYLLIAAFLLAALFLVSYSLIYYGGNVVRTDARPIQSIAVLPFQTIGEQNRDDKIGFGMADAIITRLSKLQKIPVRPTSAVFHYAEHPVSNALEAGRDLGVDAVLEGTIQREGETVRVSVRLSSVADGKPLWADTFDEKPDDVFTLQDLISTQVVRSLALKLTPEQEKLLGQRATDDPKAFEDYQLGIYLWNTRTRENLEKAKNYFERAIEIDPDFARAYGMLADTYYLIAYYGKNSNNEELYEKARFNAQKALALDDSVAEAYLALAAYYVYMKNLDMAQHYLEDAVQRAPYNSTVRVRYAWLLLRLEKKEQAVQEMTLAREYDPLSPVTNGALCSMMILRENFPLAVEVCRRAVDISANTADNRLSLAYALFFNGNHDEAIKQVLINIERNEQKYDALGSLGYFYAKLDRRAEAESIVAQLKPSAEKEFGLYTDLILINYTLGRKDEAFGYFKKVYEKGRLSVVVFRNDPVWKDIRQDSRFVKLVEGF